MKRTAFVLIVLLIPTLASAEGAWVLWEMLIVKGEGKWGIHSAYPNYDLCIKANQSAQTKNLNYGKIIYPDNEIGYSDNGFSIFEESSEGKRRVILSYESKCLPEHLDPRK